MDTKEMRAALKNVVDIVPRNNETVIALFKEKFPEISLNEYAITVSDPIIEEIEEEIWTYIGAGHEPPQIIKFMDRQVFMRGHPTKVTDQIVLEKIRNHRCFAKGNINGESILDQDEKEKAIFEQKRRENEIIQRNAALMFKG